MPWFSVKVILRATHSNSPPSDDLYDETVVVVAARTEEVALKRATQIAEAEAGQYDNVYGEIVTWEVERVLELWGGKTPSVSRGIYTAT